MKTEDQPFLSSRLFSRSAARLKSKFQRLHIGNPHLPSFGILLRPTVYAVPDPFGLHPENFRDRILGTDRYCCKFFTNRSRLSRLGKEFKPSNPFKVQGSTIKEAASMPGIRIALLHRRKPSFAGKRVKSAFSSYQRQTA